MLGDSQTIHNLGELLLHLVNSFSQGPEEWVLGVTSVCGMTL